MKTLLAIPAVVAAFVIAVPCPKTAAGSATWNLNPTSGSWNTAGNWTPATVPNGASDTATFSLSNNTNVSVNVPIEVNGITYTADASSFTITELAPLTLSGVGISNQSGATQSFVVGIGGTITFNGSASASGGTFTTSAATTLTGLSGKVNFNDNASAGDGTFVNSQVDTSTFNPPSVNFLGSSTAANSTIINNGSSVNGGLGGSVGFAAAKAGNAIISNKGGAVTSGSRGGLINFYSGADAENAMITNEAGTVSGAGGGQLQISAGSSAGNAVIVNEGATVSGAYGGATFFVGGGAGSSTIIAKNGIPGQYAGGVIQFNYDALGENARIEVFGNGYVDIYNFNGSNTENTFGSIEGTGNVILGNRNLTVGLNDLNTTFAGVISGGVHNDGRYGHLTKAGTGKLILTNGNTYFGGTTLQSGTLLVNNTTGSGLGTGPVQTVGGTLGGTGIITTRVTIGTGSGRGAVLRPGLNARTPRTLTITDKLTLNADANYRVTLNSNTPAVGGVIAAGVAINGSQIAFQDAGSAALPPGTIFTVISNTGANPISGTFANLADGSTVTVGVNKLQASYSGGDGNDLTLTVVP